MTTQLLTVLNQLTLKAVSQKSREELLFLMLNDTLQLARYDRASLFDLSGTTPKLLGVSGQSVVSPESETAMQIQDGIAKIPNPSQPQLLTDQTNPLAPAVLWLPIKPSLGFWIERWAPNNSFDQNELQVLGFLAQSYGVAWEKFLPRWKLPFTRNQRLIGAAVASLILILFPVPLRVVAPFEVVPKDPILITAPLEGVIEKMAVVPGQSVKKGELLFLYDKQLPLSQLEIAKKQVDVAQSQLRRSITLGVNKQEELEQAEVWRQQLEKERISLRYAEQQVKLLEVPAPLDGVTIFNDPQEWRGRPVQIGERVLLVANPTETKVKISLSESDNIPIRSDIPIKLILDVNPAYSWKASLTYIAAYIEVTPEGVPSFTAEATWIDTPPNVKMGLRGSAILYGPTVPLIYWLVRKPLATLRYLVAM